MEERLTDLETRYMQQERTIHELLDTVNRQQLALERLERQMTEIREQMEVILPSLVVPPGDEEPPPHY